MTHFFSRLNNRIHFLVCFISSFANILIIMLLSPPNKAQGILMYPYKGHSAPNLIDFLECFKRNQE